MKIRNGFVSNSSSSSFVLLGVRYTGSDAMEILKENNLDGAGDEEIIGINYFTMYDDDDDINETIASPAKIQKDFDKLQTIFGKDAEIKWFYGTEGC